MPRSPGPHGVWLPHLLFGRVPACFWPPLFTFRHVAFNYYLIEIDFYPSKQLEFLKAFVGVVAPAPSTLAAEPMTAPNRLGLGLLLRA